MSFILLLIATIIWAIGALLAVFHGHLLWVPLVWAIIGLPFFSAAFLAGSTPPWRKP